MKKIRRNDPCPCGSGLKYKKCCGTDPLSKLAGLIPGLRMKGGVGYDPDAQGWVAIVHTWDNVACRGEPDEWRSPHVFDTEEAAMQYYKTVIRPQLDRMMRQFKQERKSVFSINRRLED